MRLEVAKRAQREAKRLGQWWLENRDKAPELFEQELAAAYNLILHNPEIGQTYRVSRNRRIQRVLMPGTKNHVYYHRKSEDLVRVVSVWGARRGRGPKL
jgi:plasmid stabilization system protein ParE